MGIMDDEVQIRILNIHETPDYVVHVGVIPGDKLPLYLVFHKKFGVLEFTHNMIYFVKQAVAEMQEKLDEQENEERHGQLFPFPEPSPGKAN
jgi:hypothetical protein